MFFSRFTCRQKFKCFMTPTSCNFDCRILTYIWSDVISICNYLQAFCFYQLRTERYNRSRRCWKETNYFNEFMYIAHFINYEYAVFEEYKQYNRVSGLPHKRADLVNSLSETTLRCQIWLRNHSSRCRDRPTCNKGCLIA